MILNGQFKNKCLFVKHRTPGIVIFVDKQNVMERIKNTVLPGGDIPEYNDWCADYQVGSRVDKYKITYNGNYNYSSDPINFQLYQKMIDRLYVKENKQEIYRPELESILSISKRSLQRVLRRLAAERRRVLEAI